MFFFLKIIRELDTSDNKALLDIEEKENETKAN